MAVTIVVTGKGGVGKTVLSALIVKALASSGKGTVLAVDGDPNLNLDRALGVAVEHTVGSIREATLKEVGSLPGGMAKAEYLDYRTREALVETEHFDLIAMGQPEGPGCYCYANSVLRQVVDTLSASYDYVVVDCEAGLEHLSRRTASRADYLIVVTDPSVRSAQTVQRVVGLAADLSTPVGRSLIVGSRGRNGMPPAVQAILAQSGLSFAAIVPEDETIRALDDAGEPVSNVPDDNPAYRAVCDLLRANGIAQVG